MYCNRETVRNSEVENNMKGRFCIMMLISILAGWWRMVTAMLVLVKKH